MIKQIAAAALALGVSATGALAEYPDRPVSIVVPFPPGDLEDVLTRMVAEDFQEAYGVPTAVINVPGGGGGPSPAGAGFTVLEDDDPRERGAATPAKQQLDVSKRLSVGLPARTSMGSRGSPARVPTPSIARPREVGAGSEPVGERPG